MAGPRPETLRQNLKVRPLSGTLRWDPRVGPLSLEKLLKTFASTLNLESITES